MSNILAFNRVPGNSFVSILVLLPWVTSEAGTVLITWLLFSKMWRQKDNWEAVIKVSTLWWGVTQSAGIVLQFKLCVFIEYLLFLYGTEEISVQILALLLNITLDSSLNFSVTSFFMPCNWVIISSINSCREDISWNMKILRVGSVTCKHLPSDCKKCHCACVSGLVLALGTQQWISGLVVVECVSLYSSYSPDKNSKGCNWPGWGKRS